MSNPQTITDKFSYPTTSSLNNYVFSGAVGNLSGPKFIEKSPNNSITTVGLNFFATNSNDINFNNPSNGDYRINSSSSVTPIDYCNTSILIKI